MKICCINPNLSGDLSIVDIGLAYLATYIQQRTDHSAFIFDQTYHRLDWRRELGRRIEEEKPDLVGITVNSMYLPVVREIISFVKKRFGLPIILGGYHTTLMPEDSIAMEGVDAICIGDGEFALKEYLDRMASGLPLKDIPGLWINYDGEVNKGQAHELIQDLDSLPVPDYTMWEDIDRFCFFNGMMYFIGNRGCPYGCTYCSSQPYRESIPGKHFRIRDPEKYVEEIQQQYEIFGGRGMRIAHTFDSVFTIHADWLDRFCRAYRKCGLADRLPFSAFSRADTIDKERADMLSSANCRIIRIGIEAGGERMRNEVYKKNISNQQYRKTFELLHERNIAVTGYNIIGGPGETWESMKDTFRFVGELKVDRPIFFTYRPLPRTMGSRMVTEMGGQVDEEMMSQLDSLHNGTNVSTADLKPWQIIWFRRWCLFYYNLLRVFRLLRIQKLDFLKNFIVYIYKGVQCRLSLQYITGYFLVSGGDNLYH